VEVNNGGEFTMNGGRITHNESYAPGYSYPTLQGQSMLMLGATFNMNNGSIDNNTGVSGGVHLGDMFADNYEESRPPAT